MSVTVERSTDVPRLLNVRPSAAAKSALWAMSREERVEAMWRGQLTLFQLTKWAAEAPDEGPTARRRVRVPRHARPRMVRAVTPRPVRVAMSQPHHGADIRGYYAALGIHLSIRTDADVTIRCFADPEAHRRGDHNASCSVNLTHGAWHCHGCGARGGPYDAAVHQGYTSRTAIDLMIRHGLTQRRAPTPRQRQPSSRHSAYICPRIDRPGPAARLTVTDSDISRWRRALDSNPDLIERLERERGWELDTIHELEIGVDRGRITIPVRDHRRRLVGLLHNRPWSKPGQIKMQAAVGSRRQLLPHPAHEPSHRILLVEGEPDMIAARSRRLPAIALPGVQSWRTEWVSLFAERQVTIIMDADQAGRESAARINRDLRTVAAVRILDLSPGRNDGYDLTNWLRANRPVAQA